MRAPGSTRLPSWSAFGALILLGGRSETVRGLRGDGRDERFRQIDLAATALAGIVLITVIIGAFLVEVARGQDGSPYAALGAVAGVAYLVAVVALRLRARRSACIPTVRRPDAGQPGRYSSASVSASAFSPSS